MTTGCAETVRVGALSEGGFVARLPDGRLHLQQGPIDLIVSLDAPSALLREAERLAVQRFDGLLQALVVNLPSLRRSVAAGPIHGDGAGARVARRMRAATDRFASDVAFVTPMAAVAGAVADELLDAVTDVPGIARAAINNGGDIALSLAPDARYEVALCADVAQAGDARRRADAGLTMTLSGPAVCGVATSGWQGRSLSFGIADAVTVIASSAAVADAAATLIANAVDTNVAGRVDRVPATELDPDSDLGTRPVTIGVARLGALERHRALMRGLRLASRWCEAGWIDAVALQLQGETVTAGPVLGALDERLAIRQHQAG